LQVFSSIRVPFDNLTIYKLMNVVGVNGFGRIGRYFTRLMLEDDGVNIALINDPADTQTLMHLLKYDSVHRTFSLGFTINGDHVVFENGKEIYFSHEKEPKFIPWKKHNVDLVIESSGFFLTKELAEEHLKAGAQKVIISAPAADEIVPIVTLGVSDLDIIHKHKIISNASCTTNNLAPMLKVLYDLIPIESCHFSTIHSYTSDQRLHDSPHRDLRRARAAANSIVPTTTGATRAISKVFPELQGKVTGGSIRVPVINGSLTELTLYSPTPKTTEEINRAFKIASETNLKGILGYTEDPIVSIDIIDSPLSCLFDSNLTSVVGNLVKVVGWYDNEAGYSNRLKDLIKLIH
jgi:glyceraldehyde 3-phosphate dehydrogenase